MDPSGRSGPLWVADVTYCSTWSGTVYVAFVIDVFSRRIVGWTARTMHSSLVLDALNLAAWFAQTIRFMVRAVRAVGDEGPFTRSGARTAAGSDLVVNRFFARVAPRIPCAPMSRAT